MYVVGECISALRFRQMSFSPQAIEMSLISLEQRFSSSMYQLIFTNVSKTSGGTSTIIMPHKLEEEDNWKRKKEEEDRVKRWPRIIIRKGKYREEELEEVEWKEVERERERERELEGRKMRARRTEQVNICFRYVLPPPFLRSP
jgi:hypothetical protein